MLLSFIHINFRFLNIVQHKPLELVLHRSSFCELHQYVCDVQNSPGLSNNFPPEIQTLYFDLIRCQRPYAIHLIYSQICDTGDFNVLYSVVTGGMKWPGSEADHSPPSTEGVP
jgi:hypothetical protein